MVRPGRETGGSESAILHGIALYRGQRVPKNVAEGVKWLQRSAEQDNPEAQLKLANMYFNGAGVKKDISKAQEWYSKAAALGDKEAEKRLQEIRPTAQIEVKPPDPTQPKEKPADAIRVDKRAKEDVETKARELEILKERLETLERVKESAEKKATETEQLKKRLESLERERAKEKLERRPAETAPAKKPRRAETVRDSSRIEKPSEQKQDGTTPSGPVMGKKRWGGHPWGGRSVPQMKDYGLIYQLARSTVGNRIFTNKKSAVLQ